MIGHICCLVVICFISSIESTENKPLKLSSSYGNSQQWNPQLSDVVSDQYGNRYIVQRNSGGQIVQIIVSRDINGNSNDAQSSEQQLELKELQIQVQLMQVQLQQFKQQLQKQQQQQQQWCMRQISPKERQQQQEQQQQIKQSNLIHQIPQSDSLQQVITESTNQITNMRPPAKNFAQALGLESKQIIPQGFGLDSKRLTSQSFGKF